MGGTRMVASIITAVITGICSIVVAIMGYRQNNNLKEQKIMAEEQKAIAEEQKKNGQRRWQENMLSMKMQFANVELGKANSALSEAVAQALQTNNFDGPVTAAREQVNKAREEADRISEEYRAFIMGIAAQQTTKI